MLGKQGYLVMAIIGLIAACFAAAPPVEAVTLSISPRTDCHRV